MKGHGKGSFQSPRKLTFRHIPPLQPAHCFFNLTIDCNLKPSHHDCMVLVLSQLSATNILKPTTKLTDIQNHGRKAAGSLHLCPKGKSHGTAISTRAIKIFFLSTEKQVSHQAIER